MGQIIDIKWLVLVNRSPTNSDSKKFEAIIWKTNFPLVGLLKRGLFNNITKRQVIYTI